MTLSLFLDTARRPIAIALRKQGQKPYETQPVVMPLSPTVKHMIVQTTPPSNDPAKDERLKLNLTEKYRQDLVDVGGTKYFVDVYLPSETEYDEMRDKPEDWLKKTKFRENALVGFILQTEVVSRP